MVIIMVEKFDSTADVTLFGNVMQKQSVQVVVEEDLQVEEVGTHSRRFRTKQ